MGIVSYDGNRLIPAPLVNINKTFQSTPDGTVIGSTFGITINGTIVAYMGSPSSSGTFWQTSGYPADENIATNSRLGSVLRKQDAIRRIFADHGKSLEFQSSDGSQPLKCNPRIISLDFPEGIWHDLSTYTIVCEADRLYPEQEDVATSGFFISDASENWVMETNEGEPEGLGRPYTYRLTHTIDATGKTFYNEAGTLEKLAWKNARDFVLSRLGMDNQFVTSSGVNNLPSYYQGFNHVRSENVNELGGTFSVTETWLLASGSSLETFNVNSTTSEIDGTTRVSVEGNITGLSTVTPPSHTNDGKYTNAVSKFDSISTDLYTRATNYSGASLNITPVSTVIGKNPIAGTINYSYEYDNRPTLCISGSKSEVISVTQTGFSDVFAAIPVLGRACGPVLQDIGTSDPRTRGLSIEVVFGPTIIDCTSIDTIKTGLLYNPTTTGASGDIRKIIQAVDPTNDGSTTSFRSAPVETWEPRTGRYTYQCEWTYE